jgi:UDP-3-O-acyl-N-acetylglucosamine deacetylase
VRHKILDLLGDLVLLGKPLLAHVVAVRGGHALHTRLVKAILDSSETFESVVEAEPAEVAAPSLVRSAR